MSLPFYFKGKLGDALLLSEEKQRLEKELDRPKVIGSGRMSGKHGLRGEAFFNAWDKALIRKVTNVSDNTNVR